MPLPGARFPPTVSFPTFYGTHSRREFRFAPVRPYPKPEPLTLSKIVTLTKMDNKPMSLAPNSIPPLRQSLLVIPFITILYTI